MPHGALATATVWGTVEADELEGNAFEWSAVGEIRPRESRAR